MYISKLEIFGFKSFAKKTNLKFGPGIAGIVGPNGCGKTNVVDAIRWVLGEQKTTVLRSDNMQEVIFNGSQTMKPLGMCEVSLTIHNNKGVLPVEYNDVVVTRRLYRDGQSEYLLNKQVCRLKDIQNLFIDTGMSSDAYSVIELKMVESILSDAKDERARMFEEAAGINKYKMERRSARRKLDATKEDLLRINDILYEIEKNVSSLRRQMRKYERYQRYESELRTKEIQLASHKLWELEGDIIPLEEQLERGKDFQSSSAEQIEIDEAIQTSLKEAIEEQSNKVEELNSELNQVDEALQESRRNILVWSEQRSAAEKSVERLNQEEVTLENRKTQTQDQLDNLQSDLEQLNPKLNDAHQAYDRQQEQYQQIDARYQSVRSRLDELQEEKIESITELADLRNKRERLLENRERAEKEIEQERSRIDNLGQELREKEQNLEDIRAELASLESGNVDREEHIQQLRQKQDGLQTDIEQTREKLLKLESREDVIRSKIDFYQELIENREGFSAGVQYLTSEHQSVEGILGTVADVIQVDPDYELAVENALGDQAEYLIANSRQSARNAIYTVSQAKRGRVSIIPLDLVDKISLPELESQNGFTRLTEHLSFQDKFAQVVQLLLGDVFVGDSLDPVLTNGSLNGEARFVTMNGDMLERSGIMRGGRTDSEYSSRVGRQDTLNSLEGDLKSNQEEQEKVKSELSSLQNQIQDVQEGLTKFESREHQDEEKRKNLSQQVARLEYDISRTKQQRQESDFKIDDLRDQITSIDDAIQELDPALTELQEQRQQMQQRITAAETELDDIGELRNEENNKLQDLRLEVAGIENEQKTLKIRLSSARETLSEISSRFNTIEEERAEAQHTIKQRTEALEFEQEKVTELEESYQQIQQRRDEQREVLREKQRGLQEVEERIREKHRERESQFDRIRSVEREMNDLKSERRSILERIRDRYNVEIESEQIADDLNPEEISQEITSLRSRIDRMGPVNMAVKDEYEEEQDRLDFLTSQRDDLLQAEEDLLETIEKIDTQAKKQFDEVFQAIRTNFHKTFAMFFPGGTADLKMVGDSDPLEAEVEIEANPAGKELQSLRVLSAGEKTLTAIAILFAIYMYKPSPFCILDEVDAPLDDNNSQIFTRVLDEFTDDTQFIIVTHNKITMESSDYMYGITMQDKGVSKVVSVNFD